MEEENFKSQKGLFNNDVSSLEKILDSKEQVQFDRLRSHFMAEIKPKNPKQVDLVDFIVKSLWHMRSFSTFAEPEPCEHSQKSIPEREEILKNVQKKQDQDWDVELDLNFSIMDADSYIIEFFLRKLADVEKEEGLNIVKPVKEYFQNYHLH